MPRRAHTTTVRPVPRCGTAASPRVHFARRTEQPSSAGLPFYHRLVVFPSVLVDDGAAAPPDPPAGVCGLHPAIAIPITTTATNQANVRILTSVEKKKHVLPNLVNVVLASSSRKGRPPAHNRPHAATLAWIAQGCRLTMTWRDEMGTSDDSTRCRPRGKTDQDVRPLAKWISSSCGRVPSVSPSKTRGHWVGRLGIADFRAAGHGKLVLKYTAVPCRYPPRHGGEEEFCPAACCSGGSTHLPLVQ